MKLPGKHGKHQLHGVHHEHKFAKVSQGFLEAFNLNFNIEALLFCIYDEDQALLFLDVAYQALQQALHDKTTSDMIGDLVGAGIGVFGAYQQFQQGLPACEAIFKDKDVTLIDETMDFFENKHVNIDTMIKTLKKYDLEEIRNDVTSAMYQYKTGDYEKFGKFIGNFMQLLAGKEIPNQPLKTPEMELKEDIMLFYTEFAQGFLEATKVGTFNFTNLLLCIYEADQAAIALYEGVETLEQAYADKDWQEAIGGVIAVVAFVQGMQQALPICEQVDSSKLSWTEFDKISAVTKNEETMIKMVEENIKVNGVTITEEFVQAMLSFEKGNYKDFGFQLGEVIMTATKDVPENMFLYWDDW